MWVATRGRFADSRRKRLRRVARPLQWAVEMSEPTPIARPPRFDHGFRRQLELLFRWRRDVRRFRTDPVDTALVDTLIGLAALAPSVGNSQPWRFVKVDDPARRDRIRRNFEACNRDALADYAGERARLYAELKLSGLDRAPVHLAVFADRDTGVGSGLGRRTMPETLAYSVVGAVHTLWLAARAYDIGVGWVSILDPEGIRTSLDLPEGWALVAYLCLGYPQEEHLDPELERYGWQRRIDLADVVVQR
jgi:5,6-dimethylbenzimidazole synthase